MEKTMSAKLHAFLQDQTGNVAIKCAQNAALISVAIIFSVRELGSSISRMFNTISAALNTANQG